MQPQVIINNLSSKTYIVNEKVYVLVVRQTLLQLVFKKLFILVYSSKKVSKQSLAIGMWDETSNLGCF